MEVNNTPSADPSIQTLNVAPISNDWTSGLNPESKGYVETKGFKDPGSVIESYRNLEKLMGVPRERLVTIPEKDDDVDGWKNVYDKFGRPSRPDDYKLELPKEFGDEKFTGFLKNTFHELGLSKKQGETLMAKYGEYFGSQVSETKAEMEAAFTADQNALKKEWGAALDQNTQLAKRAATAFGMDAKTIDKLEMALGYSGVMKFMHTLGSKLGESNFVSGEGNGGNFGALTPAGAQSRINALKSDPTFVSKYLAKDGQAMAEMERLQKWANPE